MKYVKYVVVVVITVALSVVGTLVVSSNLKQQAPDTVLGQWAIGADLSAATDLGSAERDSHGGLSGYLPDQELPDSTQFLGLPPKLGADNDLGDVAVAKSVADLKGTDRWALAALDARLDNSAASCEFNCAIGVNISEAETPHLYALVLRTATTSNAVSGAMKVAQMKTRPFVYSADHPDLGISKATCTPADEVSLSKNGAYPSGHTSHAYAMGLVLSQVDPEDTTKIMTRARQFAESRVVCNVHWMSDVLAGREVAATTFARLQSNPSFQADLALAKDEFKVQKEKNEVPTKSYLIPAPSGDVPGAKEVVDSINQQILNWDCAKEEKVLSSFNLIEK
ncbi:MAG: phosphatase PAP2 family protein [Candidatus Ancillula sp.]|jgi:acid phosphatase (class A)|nr:phosphatase PAP2 family protein [Candidatus Ancillula sp.]